MMSISLSHFRVNDLYSSTDFQTQLGVGNAGGVRLCRDDQGGVQRMAILTSLPTARQLAENPYHDRMEGDVLVYTGAGREGDQSLAGINKRIPQQVTASFPIYGFELIGSRRDRSIGRNRWRFMGLLEYIRHYPESQLDVRSQMRQVWIFEFQVHTEPALVALSTERDICRHQLHSSNLRGDAALDDRQVVAVSTNSATPGEKDCPIEIEAERAQLLLLSPQQFEEIVRATLIVSGFEKVVVTKYSQDGGIDVNAYAGGSMWPIRELLLQVQAKRWLHTVGRKEVAELRGSLQPFARGAVVTTSHFSKAATTEAQEQGKNPVVLLDGYSFARIVRSYRLENLL